LQWAHGFGYFMVCVSACTNQRAKSLCGRGQVAVKKRADRWRESVCFLVCDCADLCLSPLPLVASGRDGRTYRHILEANRGIIEAK
jgi:hypothetical protein